MMAPIPIFVLALLSLTCIGAGLLIPRVQECTRRHAEQERYRCAEHGLTYEPLRLCCWHDGRRWRQARLCFECAVAREAISLTDERA